MLFTKAFAQAPEVAEVAIDAATQVPPAPSPITNLIMLGVMVVLFYVLLIMPQQKRFKEHKKVLDGLEKGDSVVTGGGLIGTVSKIIDDEVLEIELADKLTVLARRASIAGKAGEEASALVAAQKKKAAPKKAAAKKTAAKKDDK